MYKTERIVLKGFKTEQEATRAFINTYCRWVSQVEHYAPKNAIDLMNKIEFELVETHKRGKYKGAQNHEHIFIAKYSYGR